MNGRARLSSSISAVPIMRGAACAGMDTVVAFIDCANLRKCAICDLSPIQGYGTCTRVCGGIRLRQWGVRQSGALRQFHLVTSVCSKSRAWCSRSIVSRNRSDAILVAIGRAAKETGTGTGHIVGQAPTTSYFIAPAEGIQFSSGQNATPFCLYGSLVW